MEHDNIIYEPLFLFQSERIKSNGILDDKLCTLLFGDMVVESLFFVDSSSINIDASDGYS